MGNRYPFQILLLTLAVLSIGLYSCFTPSAKGDGEERNSSSGTEVHEVAHIKGDAEFQQEVLDYEGIVLVDFTAGWCPPCRKLSPHIDKLSGELDGKLKVVKVYEDDQGKPNENLLKEYDVKAFPTLVIIKGGNELDRKLGYMEYSVLKSWAEKNL